MRKKIIKKVKETEIQSAICDYLALKKHFFWRQNSSGSFQNGKFVKLPKYSMSGLPDIIVIKDGFFIGLEVKKQNTKQNKNQKEFEKGLKNAGGEYYVVRNIDDVKNIGL